MMTNIAEHYSLAEHSYGICRREWNQNEGPHYGQNQMGMGALGAAGMGGVLGYALGGMRGGPGWPHHPPHHHGPGGFGPGRGHHHGPRSPLDVCWSCLSL